MKLLSCTILLALLLASAGAATSAVESGDQVIVVYNTRLPASKEVAEYYAKQRLVPDSQVLGFDLPTTEIITRPEFRTLLQRPLFNYLVLRGIWTLALPETVSETAVPGQWIAQSSIRYLVLCYGVPLKIQHDATLREERAANVPAHLGRNDAAVDSELTWLPLSRRKTMLTGPMPNPYFATTNLHAMHPTNGLLLVARLDGPTPEIARGLVDKALEAETHGLWGRAYFDARGLTNGQYLLGDEWMRRAARAARELGIETALDDKPETFSQTFPMSHIAFYAGWYDGDVSGPFTRPQVEFMPGAFAYHLHSFSATTIRSATQHWVGPLLAKGVTATLGYVEEPFLPYTSDVPTLFQSLILRGASFGEAAWSAERAISWQTTVVGDPLYRPCVKPLDLMHRELELRHSRFIEWSHLLVVNRNLVTGLPPQELISYLNQIPFTQYSAVLTERLGDLWLMKNNTSEAVTAYQHALQRDPSPQQKVRLLQTIASLQTAEGQDKPAAATWQQFLKECPDYAKPLEVYEKLLSLGRKLNERALILLCEDEIKRLSPPAPPPSTNPPVK